MREKSRGERRSTFIRRISKKKLAANGGKMFSTIAPSSKRIPQVNVEATARRRARNAKRMRGPEYKAARAGAMERAGGRCEFVVKTTIYPVPVIVPEGCGISNARAEFYEHERCPETRRLHFHEEHYARGRILTADDGKIYCPPHHRFAESKKPHKWGKRAFA